MTPRTVFTLPLAVAAWWLIMAADAATPALPLAIQGYDPVAYFTDGRARPGDLRFEFEWDEHRWQFTSAAHRDLFKADPVRYAPQFSSFCAVALSRGEVKVANPEYWLISEGRLYLFGKREGPQIFARDLENNLARAERNRALLPRPQRAAE